MTSKHEYTFFPGGKELIAQDRIIQFEPVVNDESLPIFSLLEKAELFAAR